MFTVQNIKNSSKRTLYVRNLDLHRDLRMPTIKGERKNIEKKTRKGSTVPGQLIANEQAQKDHTT